MRVRAVLAFVLLGAVAGCNRTEQRESAGAVETGPWDPRKITEVRGVDANQIRAAITTMVEGARPKWATEHQWRHVRQVYGSYARGPVWLEKEGIGDRVKAVAEALTAAHEDGLRLDAYPLPNIVQHLRAVEGEGRPTAQVLAQLDLLLTAAYVGLAEDLLTGQVDPRTVAQSWNIDPQEERVDTAIVRAVRAEKLREALAAMRPDDPVYAFLQKQLGRYREIVAGGGWGTIPAGRQLKPGQRDTPARLAALQRRLRAEGFLTDSAASDSAVARGIFTPALSGAVAAWQAMHGIGVDSMLGAETVEALNRPATFRMGQIAANLERMRWLPRSLGSRYIFVNVPAFRLEAYDEGKKALEMKVIVGAEYEDRATPVFADTMAFVVFRPYWNVTDDIAEKELWPKIRSTPGYMEANNYETFNDGGTTRIRQRPGPKNSLGLVKFMFPNSFNIYLHDTPQDELFEKDVRAFSHGCIRLEKPAELAQWVLGWDAGRVQQAMQSGTNDRRVNLPRSIPVYIGYFTTYQRDDRLYFGNDLYDRDDKLVAALAAGGSSPAAIQAAQELRRLVS